MKLAVILLLAAILFGISPMSTGGQRRDAASDLGPAFPRLAAYYLGPIDDPTRLSYWDVAVVGAEEGISAQYAAVKASNPKIKLLPYIAAEEPAYHDSAGPTNTATGFSASWYLHRADGSIITGWGGRPLINTSTAAPTVNGRRWFDHLAAWTTSYFHDQGLGDGVFYDNAWNEISWVDPGVDLGVNDVPDPRDPRLGQSRTDQRWQSGMLTLMETTRGKFGPSAIIVGNGDLLAFSSNNGRLNEGFDNWVPEFRSWDWNANLQDYFIWNSNHYGGNFYILNHSSTKADYQTVRFYLGTTLLGDGYFSFDGPDGYHYSLWWYDEFSVDLTTGTSTGDASHKGYLGRPLAPANMLANGVWRRNFTNGVVLVNPTKGTQSIDLERRYRRLRGQQAPDVNDGQVTSHVLLPGRDSIILLNEV